jgi:DNA-binding NarL/FixJ family response regulator
LLAVPDRRAGAPDEVSKRFQILVVDDHEAMRRGVRSLLTRAALWEVCGEAVNGRDAVEKARALKPDLIVMDLSMPDINGLEASRLIRLFAPRIKIVVFSMHESPQVRQDCRAAGADAFVSKSASEDDLIDAIRSLLPAEANAETGGNANDHQSTQN